MSRTRSVWEETLCHFVWGEAAVRPGLSFTLTVGRAFFPSLSWGVAGESVLAHIQGLKAVSQAPFISLYSWPRNLFFPTLTWSCFWKVCVVPTLPTSSLVGGPWACHPSAFLLCLSMRQVPSVLCVLTLLTSYPKYQAVFGCWGCTPQDSRGSSAPGSQVAFPHCAEPFRAALPVPEPSQEWSKERCASSCCFCAQQSPSTDCSFGDALFIVEVDF